MPLSMAGEVINYFYSELPPYEYINKDNKAAGIGIDAVKKLFDDSNLLFHYSSINRGIKHLEQGRYDFVSIISPSDKTRKGFHVSTSPIYSIQLGVVRHRNTPQITSFDELFAHSIVTLKSATYQSVSQQLPPEILNNIRYNVDSFDEALQLISSSKFPYFLTYQYEDKILQSKTLTFDTLIDLPVFMALSKKHPRANYLNNLMNNAIANQ